MKTNTLTLADRASFEEALAAVYADHAKLRRLAVAASRRSDFSADDVMSLAEAMTEHERIEDRLFAPPFLTRPPEIVVSTAARARQRCLEYTSGNFHLPDPRAAAALFVDALLGHLAAEEAWLAREKEHQDERMLAVA